MFALLRVLLMIALAVVTVSTAQHGHAAEQPQVDAVHAAHSGHANDVGDGQERGDDHRSMVCCPSVSIHCGAGAVLNAPVWTSVERTLLALSRSPRDKSAPVDILPEFEPPPPRA